MDTVHPNSSKFPQFRVAIIGVHKRKARMKNSMYKGNS